MKNSTFTTPDNRAKWWFKASNLDQTAINIHPKLPEHFDIAYVRNIIGTDDGLSSYLTIVPKDLRPWPQEKKRIEEDIENNTLEIGWTYTLFLSLIGDNFDPKHYELKFKVDAPAQEDVQPRERLGESELKKRVHVFSIVEVSEQHR